MMVEVTLRTTSGEFIAAGTGETWQQAVISAYNEHYGYKGRRACSIGLARRIDGGSTIHVQMGVPYRGGMALDPTIVVKERCVS